MKSFFMGPDIMKTGKYFTALFLTLALLGACSKKDDQQVMLQQAVAIEKSDECHLCGMLITHFDGPKGEVFRKETGDRVFKFCSTRDMFSYYLDPENKRNIAQILVHDMSKMPWGTINDEYFIDAKTAWYVSGSEKTGAMGKTLASFSLEVDATAFAKEFGGEVLNFNDIKLETML
jgi:copper chaperone NosL